MKFWSVLFAILMFAALFGVPAVQTFIEDDNIIVFQEAEEKDAEESEDIKLKDAFEKLYYSNGHSNDLLLAMSGAQLKSQNHSYSIASQHAGVDTPPPEFS